MSPNSVEKRDLKDELFSSTVDFTGTSERHMNHIPNASAVDSLKYAIVCIGSDLSQTVLMVSRHMHNPSRGHWEAVKWILLYIKDTIDVGLIFEIDFTGNQKCITYSDSDYPGDLNKSLSTIEYVFTLSQALVSWRSTLQSIFALFTTEVKYDHDEGVSIPKGGE